MGKKHYPVRVILLEGGGELVIRKTSESKNLSRMDQAQNYKPRTVKGNRDDVKQRNLNRHYHRARR